MPTTQRPSLLDFDYQFVQVYMSKIEFKRQNGDLLPSSTQYGLVFPIFHETRQQDMPRSLLAEQAEQSVATGDLHYSHSCPSQSLEPCSDFNACFTGAIARRPTKQTNGNFRIKRLALFRCFRIFRKATVPRR